MQPLLLDTPFGFSIDISLWEQISNLPPAQMVGAIMAIIGWVIVALILFFMASVLWANYRTGKYCKKWKWVLLAVDIPPLFVQSPKAVEQIFAHFSGARISPNIGEKYWLGKRKKFFSIETISIEGYIQFLIRTEEEFRDLVEAAVYAQYPEAEITEVEDYVDRVPNKYPDKDYDMFGLEFTLAEDSSYPIRTYQNFEYSISKDAVFSDPMAAILENFSRIGHGENFWMQIIVEPASNSWKEKGIQLVKEIIENKKPKAKGIGIFLGSIPEKIMQEIFNIINWNFDSGKKDSSNADDEVGTVMKLTPGAKNTVEAIEDKITKLGFKTKIRVLYVARKEVFNPSRCVDGLIGAMNQFHIIGRNAIVPYDVTSANYAFKEYLTKEKKNKFIKAYKDRKLKKGGTSYILNIEELATVWHFPLPFVKTPLVQKASVKRGEPPLDLPVQAMENPLKPIAADLSIAETTFSEKESELPPEDLPYG